MATRSGKPSAGTGKGRSGSGGSRKGGSGSRNRWLVIVIAGLVAAVAAGILIYVSTSGDATSGADTEQVAAGDLEGVAEIDALLAGIPQDGTVLGFPEAPVTLREYGDLRCPSCKAWDEETGPKVIEQLVRTKKAKLDLALWPITGDAEGTTADATNAALAALAAADQDRMWNFALLFWKNQGDETTTYATDAFVRGVATAAGVPDIAAFDAARADRAREAILQQNGTTATSNLGFNGTPSFSVVAASGAEAPLKASESDVEAIAAELEAAASQ